MNNQTIIEFGFRVIRKIMEILEVVIRRGLVGLYVLHSSDDSQPYSIMLLLNITLKFFFSHYP